MIKINTHEDEFSELIAFLIARTKTGELFWKPLSAHFSDEPKNIFFELFYSNNMTGSYCSFRDGYIYID